MSTPNPTAGATPGPAEGASPRGDGLRDAAGHAPEAAARDAGGAHAPEPGAHAHDAAGHAPNSVPAPWAKFWLLVLFGGGVATALLDLFRDRAHAEHPWEHALFFYALYGFAGISLLIVLSKGLRRLVMRREDYYGDDDG